MMRWEILNHIAETIGAKTYLEIGVYDGTCMRKIQVAEKWGVDPTPQMEAVKASHVFQAQTSDAFFAGPNTTRFDLIFIDGDHRAEQAYRDAHNAIAKLTPKGIVVLHDCSPDNEALQIVPAIQGLWTGDVWKAIVQLRAEGEHLVRVVNCDYGVGIIAPFRKNDEFSEFTPKNPNLDLANLTWRDLEQDRKNLLGLLEVSEWKEWFNSL